MRQRLMPSALALLASWSAWSAGPPVPSARMRGVCWEAQGRIGPESLAPLRPLGVDWISQTPFGWSPTLDSPEVRLATGKGFFWGESDVGLAETARLARSLGIKTLLKPHLWSHQGWCGDIRMRSEADWQAWFRSYTAFILHYARLAQSEGMEGLALGTELRYASRRTADWRSLIAHVRQVYNGPLSYCANWHEAESVEFWDVLDFIGIQAYYPLASESHPRLTEIRAAWGPIVERLEALARKTGRSIVFTEVGYKSLAGSLKEPWLWQASGETDLAIQSDAYLALFQSVWDRPWFAGSFVWKWHPNAGSPDHPPPRHERDFTPQGKPALAVIRSFYTR